MTSINIETFHNPYDFRQFMEQMAMTYFASKKFAEQDEETKNEQTEMLTQFLIQFIIPLGE